MIPRIEQKTEINKCNYLDLLKWIKNKRGRILYPERIICSRYFDNKDLQMYFDTVEGIVPRKKIRIRTYGSENFFSSDKKYSFEVKMTTEQARLKRTEDETNLENLLVNGYFIGTCFDGDTIYNKLENTDMIKASNNVQKSLD